MVQQDPFHLVLSYKGAPGERIVIVKGDLAVAFARRAGDLGAYDATDGPLQDFAEAMKRGGEIELCAGEPA